MKKTFLLFAIASVAILPAGAQLKVEKNGQVVAGNGTKFAGSLPSSEKFTNDTTAELRVRGIGQYDSGAKIALGSRGDVYISESAYNQNAKRGSLMLHGQGGFKVTTGDSTLINYSCNIIGGPIIIGPAMQAPQYLTQSDQRLKANIESLENTSELLNSINPVSYDMVGKGDQMKKKSGRSANAHRFGFIAQEVKEIFPDLVYEGEDGYLSLDYQGFIPILVDAVKTLQNKVDRQEEIIASLAPNAMKKNSSAIDDLTSGHVAKLSQNKPNPFKTSTVIACCIPEEAASAYICVYDLTGNQKLRCNIADRGDVNVTIEGNTLSAGMYIYALIIDGMEINSKRMILTD